MQTARNALGFVATKEKKKINFHKFQVEVILITSEFLPRLRTGPKVQITLRTYL